MYKWPSEYERIRGIGTIFDLFCKEQHEIYGFKKWGIKLKSETPVVFEITLDNLTREISDEEISDMQTHILFTQFIVSKTREELMYKTLATILPEKFDWKAP